MTTLQDFHKMIIESIRLTEENIQKRQENIKLAHELFEGTVNSLNEHYNTIKLIDNNILLNNQKIKEINNSLNKNKILLFFNSKKKKRLMEELSLLETKIIELENFKFTTENEIDNEVKLVCEYNYYKNLAQYQLNKTLEELALKQADLDIFQEKLFDIQEIFHTVFKRSKNVLLSDNIIKENDTNINVQETDPAIDTIEVNGVYTVPGDEEDLTVSENLFNQNIDSGIDQNQRIYRFSNLDKEVYTITSIYPVDTDAKTRVEKYKCFYGYTPNHAKPNRARIYS